MANEKNAVIRGGRPVVILCQVGLASSQTKKQTDHSKAKGSRKNKFIFYGAGVFAVGEA
jgi:hypothetical protein